MIIKFKIISNNNINKKNNHKTNHIYYTINKASYFIKFQKKKKKNYFNTQ